MNVLFENYRDNIVYSSQSKINFPRSGGYSNKTGSGSAVFLMCPNRQKGLDVLNDPVMNFTPSLTKRFVTDSIYKERIGTKNVISLERSTTDRFYLSQKDFPLMYIPYASRASVLSKQLNVVNDISRWMEIFFARIDNLSVKKTCSEFIRILKDRLNDPNFKGYDKLLVFDLNSWSASIKNCVIMNRKLLNNPLSILLFTANYYPELMEQLPNVRLMIINRAGGQIYLTAIDYITKQNYPKIKAKLGVFKSVVFSVEDDYDPTTDDNDINAEIKSEIINSFKEDIKNKLRFNLLGKDTQSPFDNIEDITGDVAEPFDELEDSLNDDEMNDDESNEPSSTRQVDSDIEESLPGFNIIDEVSKTVDEVFEDIDDIDDIDSNEMVDALSTKIKNEKYMATFIPERSEKQLAQIERLTADQEKVISQPTIDDVKRKSISTSSTGSYVKTTNANILSSKFVNFDKEYTEKCLEKNIDDSVAILSKASDKIFITGKTVTDSSTPMDLKETYTYNLVDEKGNKMTISFDVPKIIDGSYVYLNGTKKNIRHQFILKPIVKTGPDTVQIVTAYNKVFIRRQGTVNQNINRIDTYLEKNPEKFKVKLGNCSMQNSEYMVPLDFSMLSKYFAEFSIGSVTFFMSIDTLKERYLKLTGNEIKYNDATEIPVGINRKTKEPVILKLTDSYTDLIYSYFEESDKTNIAKIKRKPKFVVANAKIMGRKLPLILFMMFCEGFAAVMKKANIKYEFVDKKQLKMYDPMDYDTIELNDGYIVWQKKPFRNELLMNGFKYCDLSDFSYDDLESKDTFISLILPFYPGNSKIHNALDNYRDFLLDDKAKEILTDFGYPTDLVSLMVVAAGMLTDTDYLIENNLNNMRIRSNEVIADLVYKNITSAYNAYRSTSYKKKPTKINIKKSQIIDDLLDSDTNMIEEFSTLNPVLELEKQRSVTFKGIRGIQLDRAMTLPRRAYDKSMVGTVGMVTSPDANVGVVRALTLEPQIKSTYGYIDTSKSLDELNSANLFTVSELLNPLGVIHDDPDRTAMSFKQTKYMVPVQDADPVLIGNKVESVVPYLMSDEFVVDAKEDGKVIDIAEGFCIIEYKSGKRQAINISDRVQKNSSAGFWVDNTLVTDLKIGDKFKQGDILAYNNKHFTKNREDNGASMNLGVLCKIAISSQWDVFEDSAPISKRLSEKLTTEMVDEKSVTFSPYTHIDYIAKVGDPIKAGDPLIVFSDAMNEEIQRALNSMREENKEDVIQSAKTTISSKYTGEIVDIRVYTTSELDQLDSSLRKVVEEYWSRIKRKNDILSKYANDGDLEYYKAGQVISEVAEVVNPGKTNKVKGVIMNSGDVLILFYIKYRVPASKGDKVTVSVCKGIISHVFDEGMEPYSEYRPDEPIDTIVAPLAVAARKVPAIFLTIFGNKLLIELKRQLEEIYLDK